MTLTERHDFIMDLLQQQGSASVATLAERLKVSEVTIRKDLTMLEEKKMLYRAHGSAILSQRRWKPPIPADHGGVWHAVCDGLCEFKNRQRQRVCQGY